jgi:hypothetical protein
MQLAARGSTLRHALVRLALGEPAKSANVTQHRPLMRKPI